MPKPSRRRADNVVTMPSTDPPVAIGLASEVTDDDVPRRAYELYCARGFEDGRDVDDWLDAERDLRGAATSSAA
jgi:hypothetical protein